MYYWISGGWLADDTAPQPDDGADCSEDGDKDCARQVEVCPSPAAQARGQTFAR
jgi:hypothetical protein